MGLKMPGYNRRGPEGEGPRTGRATGYCGGNKPTEDPAYGLGRGGAPKGGGRGNGWGKGRENGKGVGFMSRNYFKPGYNRDGPRRDNLGSKVMGKLEEILDSIKNRDK